MSIMISWYHFSSIFINVILFYVLFYVQKNKMLQLLKLRLWLLCFWLQLCLGCHRTCHSGGFECVESTHGCDTCPLRKDHWRRFAEAWLWSSTVPENCSMQLHSKKLSSNNIIVCCNLYAFYEKLWIQGAWLAPPEALQVAPAPWRAAVPEGVSRVARVAPVAVPVAWWMAEASVEE